MRLINTLLRHLANAGGNLDHWLIATFIALLVSLGTASLIHGVEQHDGRLERLEYSQSALHAEIDARIFSAERRLDDIENQRTTATAKRYTSDDAARDKALLLACIKDKRDCP